MHKWLFALHSHDNGRPSDWAISLICADFVHAEFLCCIGLCVITLLNGGLHHIRIGSCCYALRFPMSFVGRHFLFVGRDDMFLHSLTYLPNKGSRNTVVVSIHRWRRVGSRATSIFPCDAGKLFCISRNISDRRPTAVQAKQDRGVGRPNLRPMRLRC